MDQNGNRREQDATRREGASAADPGRPARILVVDDVAVNREILKRRLLRRGFDVAEAEGGYEAIEVLGREAVDLVLLDIMMPDLNGIDVVRAVRQKFSAPELPIIMVSAKSRSSHLSLSLEAGANDYITKPVDFAAALERINAQLARSDGGASRNAPT